MALYTSSLESISLDNSVSRTFNAGGTVLYATFRWCTENQEQWDSFESYIARLPKSDPLYKSGEAYDRSYDWIDFYLAFEGMTAGQMVDYLKSLDFVPKSLMKYDWDSELFPGILETRLARAQDLVVYRNLFKECGVWQCIITYNGSPRVARVVPGGWACNQDNVFRFRFTSEREVIRYDDLPYVTLEVYVNE